MKSRKYIIILTIALIVFYISHNIISPKIHEFNKSEEYVFADKDTKDILKECKKNYDNLGETDQILNIVKLIQLSDYLLYRDSIDTRTYYDLMMTIMSLENRERLHHKERYSSEMDKYLNRKRKARIEYLKYEASKPIFYSRGDNKYGYVVVKTHWDSGIYYLKYSFIYEGGLWHFEESKSLAKVKEKGIVSYGKT